MCSRAIGCQLLSQSRYLRIPYCHAVTKPERMRLNIGFHILAGECGPSPCGFCGKSYQCSVGLKATKKAKAPTSDGPYFVKFSLKSAETVSDKAPCTNRPVKCLACSDKAFVTWSYSMAQHWTDMHPGCSPPTYLEVTATEKDAVLRKGRMAKAPKHK